jgi:hypothetical protein
MKQRPFVPYKYKQLKIINYEINRTTKRKNIPITRRKEYNLKNEIVNLQYQTNIRTYW